MLSKREHRFSEINGKNPSREIFKNVRRVTLPTTYQFSQAPPDGMMSLRFRWRDSNPPEATPLSLAFVLAKVIASAPAPEFVAVGPVEMKLKVAPPERSLPTPVFIPHMPTTLLPLSGARNFNDGFTLAPDDGLGAAMYDLRSVLLGTPGRFERELGESIQNRCPELRLRGTPIPWQVFLRGGDQSFAQRDLTAGGPSTGQNLVETFRRPRIESALRPFSAVARAGATFLSGLSGGPVNLPRWETASVPAAYLETAPTVPNTQTSSLLSLSPHRISSETILSRQLLRQTENMESGGLENLVAAEMLAGIGAMLDNYALNGSGASGQPFGLLTLGSNAPGSRDLSKLAPPVSFAGAATWSKLCSFIGNVEANDVVADDTSSWILSPNTREKWISTPQITAYPRYLSEDNKCVGFPLATTNNLTSSNRVIYGRWSSMIIATWAMSVLVDHVTLSTSGNVRVFVDLWADCGPVYGPAFCASSDAGNQ